MARDGYLILDSDLHMMEPDDLWARYLEGPHRDNPPRFFGGQRQQLEQKTDDKGNADTITGMEVQGLAIPAHGAQTGAIVSAGELRRRSRARHPHFQLARAQGFDPASTLTAMDIEGIDVAVMYADAKSSATTISPPIMPPHWHALITTGPMITAGAIRSGSNSQRRSRCTTSPWRSPRRAAALANWVRWQ